MVQRPANEEYPKSDRGPAFEGSIGFLLSRTGALARRSWVQMCSERNLTPRQYEVLMALAELGGNAGQGRLNELLDFAPRNAVPIIAALVDRGLLARAIDQNDGRRRVLALTRSGQTMVVDLTLTGTAIEEDFLQALIPADRSELRRVLLVLSRAAEPATSPKTT